MDSAPQAAATLETLRAEREALVEHLRELQRRAAILWVETTPIALRSPSYVPPIVEHLLRLRKPEATALAAELLDRTCRARQVALEEAQAEHEARRMGRRS